MADAKGSKRGAQEQYRQGDVLLVAVRSAPDYGTPIEPEGGRFVLAYGEATGHAHAVAAEGNSFLANGERRFLVIQGERGAELRHEEHATVPLAPGIYEVRQQREYRRPSGSLSGQRDFRSWNWVRD